MRVVGGLLRGGHGRAPAGLEVDIEIRRLGIQPLDLVVHEGERVLCEVPVGRRVVEADLAAGIGIGLDQVARRVEVATGTRPQCVSLVVARGQDSVLESRVPGGAQPLLGLVLLWIELRRVLPVLARRDGGFPPVRLDDLLDLFRREASLPQFASGDHGPRDAVLALHRRQASVNEEPEPGGGKPLRVGMRGAGKRGGLGGIVDAERRVLVGYGARLLPLLRVSGGGGGKKKGSTRHLAQL